MTPPTNRTIPVTLLTLTPLILLWSWFGAADRLTWWLESFPALIAAPILIATHKRFPFTPLAYTLIAIHMSILFVGAHYTYAQVPLFNWIRDHDHLQRNDYDKLGHLAQGFIPAIIAREILIRQRVVKSAAWLFFLVFCICMAISACYELFEWAAAVAGGTSADAFLGTQGDMFCALIGSLTAQLLLARYHNTQINQFETPRSSKHTYA